MGQKLYLASGTDQEDVIKEAKLLGYYPLFEGRVRGSLGDIVHDPKKEVIQHIIKEIGVTSLSSNSSRCVVLVMGL